MSVSEGRNFKMKLYIPPEASNIAHDEKKVVDEEFGLRRLSIAREKRISALTRILEPSFYEPFYFLHIAGPSHDMPTNKDSNAEKPTLKVVVSLVNKMKPSPKFIVLCGGLTETDKACDSENITRKKYLEEALVALNPKTRVICVPAMEDFKSREDGVGVEAYRRIYGDDWYGFWVCGVSFITINSLYFQPNIDSSLDSLRIEQEDWIDSELLQQQVFYAQWTVIFQDSLFAKGGPSSCGDGLAKEKDLRMLTKFKQAGVTHVFCRRSETISKDSLDDDVEIVANTTEDEENADWCVRLVKVTKDCIQHSLMTLGELPEYVDL